MSTLEDRSRRWMLRRLERQARRRLKAAPPRPRPRLLAVASLIDGYCEILGPAGNDDDLGPTRRPSRPSLAVVRS